MVDWAAGGAHQEGASREGHAAGCEGCINLCNAHVLIPP